MTPTHHSGKDEIFELISTFLVKYIFLCFPGYSDESIPSFVAYAGRESYLWKLHLTEKGREN